MRGADYIVKRVAFARRHGLRRDHAQLRPLPRHPGRRRLRAALPAVHGGVQGVPARAARPRQVEVGAVQALPRRPRPRRPRQLAADGEAGRERALGADQEHDADGRARDVLLDRLRDPHGGGRRLAARHGGGQGGALERASASTRCRRSGSACSMVLFVAGALGLPTSGIKDPTLGILDDASTWDGRRRPAPAHGPARADARPRALRRVRADHALGDARDARRGLRADGAGEGALELGDRVEARLPQRAAADRSRWSRSRSGSSSAGSITVEYVFSYPGIGLQIVEAIDQRDYPVLQGAFLLLTLSVIVFNLVADLLYFKLDPRVTE